MRRRLLAISLHLAALACLLVAYLNRHEEPEAYWSTVVGVNVEETGPDGWTSYGPLSNEQVNALEPFDVWNPYLWLGAGVALLLGAMVLTVLVVRDAVRRRSVTR